MQHEFFKLPRLYSAEKLENQNEIILGTEQTHYLKNVLRQKVGHAIRLFDGQSGEYLFIIYQIDKKQTHLSLKQKIADQPIHQKQIHFLFAPIKKARLDWMIEKTVELGVTDFHPIITQNTEVRKINEERMTSQILEAAEQCERFDIPQLHLIQKLDKKLSGWSSETPLYAAIERFDAQSTSSVETPKEFGFLIGPEGGFTEEEKTALSKATTAINLGDTILRCETAAIKALIQLSE
ncbi:MAG: RsmE family RNA methyltransferase [Pseudomonadota bacterium]